MGPSTPEDIARRLNYKRYYKPKLHQFVDGYEYEYVQLSFKQYLTHLPMLDEKTGRYPGCIYYQSWRKGVWGTPWGMQSIEHIKQLMKSEHIRAEKAEWSSTNEYKKLLEKNALSFNWRNMHIVIYPKKVIIHEGKEILDQHHIYINGVRESILRSKPHSKLYKKWFSFSRSQNITLDWRFLLDLDRPQSPGTNMLYNYYEGIYKGSEEQFENIGENFTTGGPNNPLRLIHTMPRGGYAKLKTEKKAIDAENHDCTIAVHFKRKAEEQISEAVRIARAITVKKLAKRKAQAIALELMKLIPTERKIHDDKNRIKMEKRKLVCMESNKTKKVHRISTHTIEKVARRFPDWEDYFKYVDKTTWRKQEDDKYHASEEAYKEKMHAYKYEEKLVSKIPVLFYGWEWEEEPILDGNGIPIEGHEGKGKYVQKVHEFVDPKIHIKIIPGFNGQTRKHRREYLQKVRPKHPNANYQHIPAKLKTQDHPEGHTDKDGNILQVPVMETNKYATLETVWEGVPVLHGEYRFDQKGTQPWRIPQYDENGNKVIGQVYKKRLNSIERLVYDVITPVIEHVAKTILQINEPSKKKILYKPRWQLFQTRETKRRYRDERLKRTLSRKKEEQVKKY